MGPHADAKLEPHSSRLVESDWQLRFVGDLAEHYDICDRSNDSRSQFKFVARCGFSFGGAKCR